MGSYPLGGQIMSEASEKLLSTCDMRHLGYRSGNGSSIYVFLDREKKTVPCLGSSLGRAFATLVWHQVGDTTLILSLAS